MSNSAFMSKPQSWAIFCATKVGVRDLPLTHKQASDLLDIAQDDPGRAREIAIALGGEVKGKLPGNAKDHQALFDKAWAAGVAAADACTPVPMVVGTPANMMASLTGDNSAGFKPDAPIYVVSSGVCGFAWVNINPGNSSFANWLKKTGRATRDNYWGGVSVRINGYGQSMEKKSAHAGAMADVLREAGIKAHSMSRED